MTKIETDALKLNRISEAIIGASIEVHRHLGPGLLESVYEECLCFELHERNLPFERQRCLPLLYKGLALGAGFRVDLVVSESVIVEIKTAEKLLPIHDAQLLTYLRLTGLTIGLLINFNVPALHLGIKRLVNRFSEE